MTHFDDEPFAFNNHDHIYGTITPSYIEASDGIHVAYYPLETNTIPKAVIVFIHGAGAHCQMADYQNIGTKLVSNDINSYFIDIRGHGNSEGTRGSTPSKERVWMDIKTLVDFITKKNKNVPIYLTGHSAGAGIVINYATWSKRLECSGYFLISPYLGWRAKSYRKTMKDDTFATAKLRYFIPNALSFGLLFGNKTCVYYNYPREIQSQDPLLVTSISCNMSKSCTLWNPKRQFGMIKKPVYLYIGSDDELFSPDKVSSYKKYISKSIDKQSRFEILQNYKHLTILPSIDTYLIEAIENIRRTVALT